MLSWRTGYRAIYTRGSVHSNDKFFSKMFNRVTPNDVPGESISWTMNPTQQVLQTFVVSFTLTECAKLLALACVVRSRTKRLVTIFRGTRHSLNSVKLNSVESPQRDRRRR